MRSSQVFIKLLHTFKNKTSSARLDIDFVGEDSQVSKQNVQPVNFVGNGNPAKFTLPEVDTYACCPGIDLSAALLYGDGVNPMLGFNIAIVLGGFHKRPIFLVHNAPPLSVEHTAWTYRAS